MFETIQPDLFRIDITLPDSPLRAINCYLIKGGEHSLLVDTGMNRDECHREMLSNLKDLNVDLDSMDLFVTHLHIDHLGLMGELAGKTSKIFFSKRESTLLDFSKHWEEAGGFYKLNGFPIEEMERALKGHPGYTWAVRDTRKFSLVQDGDTVDIGKYRFKCVETPGHSPGHMCLYEPAQKLLLSGDHILFDITPNVSMWSGKTNPLKDYISSLDKVYALDVRMVLPGHGKIFSDHRKRIIELKHHHEERANEILIILNKHGSKNAYRISALMRWDVEYGSFDELPAFQKWFAMGEALSHLRYLEEAGKVKTKVQGEDIIYTLPG